MYSCGKQTLCTLPIFFLILILCIFCFIFVYFWYSFNLHKEGFYFVKCGIDTAPILSETKWKWWQMVFLVLESTPNGSIQINFTWFILLVHDGNRFFRWNETIKNYTIKAVKFKIILNFQNQKLDDYHWKYYSRILNGVNWMETVKELRKYVKIWWTYLFFSTELNLPFENNINFKRIPFYHSSL